MEFEFVELIRLCLSYMYMGTVIWKSGFQFIYRSQPWNPCIFNFPGIPNPIGIHLFPMFSVSPCFPCNGTVNFSNLMALTHVSTAISRIAMTGYEPHLLLHSHPRIAVSKLAVGARQRAQWIHTRRVKNHPKVEMLFGLITRGNREILKNVS